MDERDTSHSKAQSKRRMNMLRDAPLNILKGIVIGVGAILPGISGGVLCVIFGIYRPMMKFLSHPFKAFKTHRGLLIPLLIGFVVGFIGLSGAISWIFRTSPVPAIWLFIGLIVGTFRSLYKTAGERGRGKASFISCAVCFFSFLTLMFLLPSNGGINIEPNIWWWLFCGALWGISLIVPGLSSSAFFIFLGLYEPMTAGIASLSPVVLLPMAAGVAVIVLLLSRIVNRLFERAYSVVYHGLFGIVCASTLVIIPIDADYSLKNIITYAICFVVGFVCAYLMDRLGAHKGDVEEAKN